MQDSLAPLSDNGLKRALLTAVLVCLSIKLILASKLDLYSDEIFYWLASTKPALAYSDLPFITALLAGLGSSLYDSSSLAVRLPFLLLGSTIPLLVYWIAKPITNSRKALESAVLSLCLPLGGFLGLLAVPDVPLLVFGLAAVGLFERALRQNQTWHWLLLGFMVALGFSTHYRFVLYPASAILFLCIAPTQRKQFTNPRFWLAVCIGAIGLIPIIWFNVNTQLASASFYFVDRHPWEFQATGLLHIFKQAGLVTPPLYFVFILTLLRLLTLSKKGERYPLFMLCFSSTHLLVYLVFAPWTDANSTSIHWPLSGYFPLLVFVPDTFRALFDWLRLRWSESIARRALLIIPILGFTGTLGAFIGIGSQAYQTLIRPIIGPNILSNKMAGWSEFAAHTNTLLNDFDSQPIIITDNYYTMAQVEFANLSDTVFTLDTDKAVRDGRMTQLQLWKKTADSIPDTVTRDLLFISEDSTLNVIEKEQVIGAMCHQSRYLNHIDNLTLFGGDKRFSFYSGRLQPIQVEPISPCPYPARAWIDQPQAGELVSGIAVVSGWAFNQDIGIENIEVLIDGEKVSQARYGDIRGDVSELLPEPTRTDPNTPALGFNATFDSTLLSNEKHWLELQLTNHNGTVSHYGRRLIIVDN